ncbi:hypothetical protein DUI87_01574 [Hirundo rustica rustica]|uniref:Uncharacterized protein n=1 Tax=Hirundo rustica rustica TaxID=333673 RepID=A0A3M0L4Z1_HIRRU|nr:hypothetical protein DUI87_01574 [Hirundo rustica rustica]
MGAGLRAVGVPTLGQGQRWTATALLRNLCPALVTERGVRLALSEQSRTLVVMMHTTCLPMELNGKII